MEETKILDLEKEKEKSKEYLKKFEKAKNFNHERQEAYSELMAFYQGNQHLLSKYKSDRPWVVNMNTPYSTVAIDNRVSSLLANDYIGDLLPLGVDDVKAVEPLANAYKREWKRMELDNLVRDSISQAAVVRESYIHIVLDNKKSIGGKGKKVLGRLEAYLIEPSRIFIDPSARNLRDARYMFVTDRISIEEAKETYSILNGIENLGDTFQPGDRGEVYVDNDYNTEQDDVLTQITYYGKSKGKIKKVIIIANIVVEENEMPIKGFPIAQLRWRKAAQSCYGLSLMDEVLGLQKAVTSIESAITNTVISYAAPSMMVRKGCGVDPRVVAKANGAPGVVYAVDGDLDNAIKPVIPPQIKQETLNIKNDYQEQIDKITGNTAQFLGDIGTAGNTSSGAETAVKRATIIEQKVLNNIREFVEDLAEIVIEYIKKIYPGETLSYNDGKKPGGGYKFTEIDLPSKDELDASNYNYYIELETKTPYSREKQKELLLELYQLERQYDTAVKTVTISDIVKNSGIENKEEIIDRFDRLTFQDANTKSDAIVQMYTSSQEAGIDEELVKQAISEVIGNNADTPALDEVLKQLEQYAQSQIQQAQVQQSNAVDMITQTPQAQSQIQANAEEIQGEDVTNLLTQGQEEAK